MKNVEQYASQIGDTFAYSLHFANDKDDVSYMI